MLLRIGRRRAVWEENDPEEICLAAFPDPGGGPGLDLSPSVYELDRAEQVVQAHAEHFASVALDFKSMDHVDIEGLTPPPVNVAGESRFAFTRDRHREIRFHDANALKEMVRHLLPVVTDRIHKVEKADLKAYVRSRLEAADPEWEELCDAQPRWAAKWASRGPGQEARPGH